MGNGAMWAQHHLQTKLLDCSFLRRQQQIADFFAFKGFVFQFIDAFGI